MMSFAVPVGGVATWEHTGGPNNRWGGPGPQLPLL